MLTGRPANIKWPARVLRVALWSFTWATGGYFIKGANLGLPYWLCLATTTVLVAGQEVYFIFRDRAQN